MNETMNMAGFEQSVREGAYFQWENEGRPMGRHVEHWLTSESAIRAEWSEAATQDAAAPAEAAGVAEIVVPAVAVAADIIAPQAPAAKPKKASPKAKAAAPRKTKPATTVRRRPALQEISATLQ